MPGPYISPSSASYSSSSTALASFLAIRACLEASELRWSARRTRALSHSSTKRKLSGPREHPIVSRIFKIGLWPSLNIHAAVSVAISNIFLPQNMCLGTKRQTQELKPSLLFCVLEPKDLSRRSFSLKKGRFHCILIHIHADINTIQLLQMPTPHTCSEIRARALFFDESYLVKKVGMA